MKVAIFTGTINLKKRNKDVRRLYIHERLKYLTHTDDIQLEIITPQINENDLLLSENIEYNTYKFINRKHLRSISAFLYSGNKLINTKCELLHCYTYQATILAWLTNFIRKEKYIIIFEPMGLLYEESNVDKKFSTKTKPLKHLIKFVYIEIEELLFKKSDAIIVYTDNLREYTSKRFAINIEKIFVVPHGINLNTPPIDEEKTDSIRNKLKIPDTNKIIMYGGSLSELHGTPYLIEAINYVNEKRQNISFIILGRGVLENKLKKYVSDNKLTNIYLLGFVSPEEMGYYLSLANILLIPHARCMQTELDQPTKLFEYLVSGKPIVSFNLKAIAEIIGKNGVLVEPDNPKALADGILSLVDNENLCGKLGAKGKIIAKKYSWEISAKKQASLYKELYEKCINK
ncbi:hypothetical protein DU57_02430 [Methanosarcina mazei]|uniref:Glycosyl transferase family 1 domain-containing protein n=1 Tax=Methanosarcina mazei TaxID=2209 RepID=A0A0F8IE98_METMZ|nr:glycosyltransferase family 4 protein [Methanosarcina mazei]KKG87426.1 hypothetical protein DU57_02430 [Methanosarcina mazei]KKG87429.1 hypothetical protein DU59_05100 [Methanosarcina mazei]KKH06669.1 hypothetical protein DU42_03885 [Methanosarcina mazei]